MVAGRNISPIEIFELIESEIHKNFYSKCESWNTLSITTKY